jgi:CubicO group peptidase (beta-lactamase class C family)
MRIIVALAGVCALAACSDESEPPRDGDLPIEPRFEALADMIESERVAGDVPGVAVLVMERGEVTFAHGFGVRDFDATQPVDAGTLFRIGSVTKVLTATALLQQVVAGNVRLDDPVTAALPDFAVVAPAGGAATIRVGDLLRHTSALADYLVIDDRHDDAALDEYVTGPYTQQAYLMAPPGVMWNYSNPNFYLAGLIAERAAGVGYRELMRERVFEPLGMTRTLFLPEEVVADGNYAVGDSASEGLVVPESYDNAWGRPAGYAFSSVHDLARFVTFLRGGDAAVLPDDVRLAMQTVQIDMKVAASHVGYGYGLFVRDGFALDGGWHDTVLVDHGGDIPGFAASMYYVPATGFAFISLASADGAHFTTSAAFALMTYAELPAPGALPADLTIDPATFPSLAGSYLDEYNAGRVEIAVDGGEVRISMPDVDAAGISYDPVLAPIRPDNFVLTVQGNALPATFVRDENGVPRYFRTRPFVATRGAAAAPAGAAVNRVNAEALRRSLRAPALH